MVNDARHIHLGTYLSGSGHMYIRTLTDTPAEWQVGSIPVPVDLSLTSYAQFGQLCGSPPRAGPASPTVLGRVGGSWSQRCPARFVLASCSELQTEAPVQRQKVPGPDACWCLQDQSMRIGGVVGVCGLLQGRLWMACLLRTNCCPDFTWSSPSRLSPCVMAKEESMPAGCLLPAWAKVMESRNRPSQICTYIENQM